MPFSGIGFLSAGHSNVPYADLARLLREHGATAVADVRSTPRSRFAPWYDGTALSGALRGDGIAYAFLGKELGGRPGRPDLYRDGVADYDAMAREPAFERGLARLGAGARSHRIAIVCSEADPLDCHRCLLVGRALSAGGATLSHLRHRAAPLSQAEVERGLLASLDEGLFAPAGDPLPRAYAARSGRVAYRPAPAPRSPGPPPRIG
jgi:hypothetical protein